MHQLHGQADFLIRYMWCAIIVYQVLWSWNFNPQSLPDIADKNFYSWKMLTYSTLITLSFSCFRHVSNLSDLNLAIQICDILNSYHNLNHHICTPLSVNLPNWSKLQNLLIIRLNHSPTGFQSKHFAKQTVSWYFAHIMHSVYFHIFRVKYVCNLCRTII